LNKKKEKEKAMLFDGYLGQIESGLATAEASLV
jgi:hypothetical protein